MAQLMTNIQTAAAQPPNLLDAVDGLSRLSAVSDSIGDDLGGGGYLVRYLNNLQRLSEMAGELGYAGLQGACLILQENVEAQLARNGDLDERVHSALDTWPGLVQGYLALTPGAAVGEALTSHLRLPLWDRPLDEQTATELQALLADERQQTAPGEEEPGYETVADTALLGLAEDPRAEEIAKVDAAGAKDRARDARHRGVPAEEPGVPPQEDLPAEIRELIAVLLNEIPSLEHRLVQILIAATPGDGTSAVWQDAHELYADYLDRFGDAAEAVGLCGLRQVVTLMRENLASLVARGGALGAREMELLASWGAQATAYLCDPHSPDACHGLIEWLQAPQWPRPLPAEQAQVLLLLLREPTLEYEDLDQVAEARPARAAPEDVSLALPEDVDNELLEALLQELPSQTRTFSEAIQRLSAGGALDDVTVAQRTAHTVKGAGNTVGVVGLATLTHHLEDILVALAKQKALPRPALALSLMNAADCLEAMGEALCGLGDPPDNAQQVLQEVLDWANRIDRDGLQEADEPAPLGQAVAAAATQPGAALAEVAAADSPENPQTGMRSHATRKRVAPVLVDELLRLGGETIILSGQVHEQVHRIDERMRSMQAELERLQRLGGELERLIDIRDLSTDRPQQRRYSEFDSLELDQYSELHTISRMLVEAATDARQIGGMVSEQLQRLDKVLLTQERLNRETQETVLRARMVPISTHVARLQRSMRQTCRLTAKQAQLHISGADTLLDGEVLSQLIDPLMHVLRNAVDHGIEPPAQRSAAGKPPDGNVWLDFMREGNNILVRCRDDGAGFDYAQIRRTAEDRGLVDPGQTISEEELKNLVLMPNFSSRSEVTQTSGRGVGLDVVYSHVLSQGGSLTLNTEAGKGSTTELRLPLSLISTHALLVRLRGQVMAIADRGIEQILHAADGKELRLGDQLCFRVGEQHYPLRYLDQVLGLPPDPRSSPRTPTPVLLVRDRTGVTAVPVQEVMAGTDLVVKEFGRYVPRMPGIVGATILGDGAVTPVLDLPELMSAVSRSLAKTPAPTPTVVDQETKRRPLALVVDDSLSARRALAQVMEDAGYEVRSARDGLEAVELARGRRPDIVLADMEMPRMNGIELTAHLRGRPDTADLPVIMITSRSTAKHRRQAEAAGVNVCLIKPFLDDELLDHVAVLRGQL